MTRDTLACIASGVMIILTDPCKVETFVSKPESALPRSTRQFRAESIWGRSTSTYIYIAENVASCALYIYMNPN